MSTIIFFVTSRLKEINSIKFEFFYENFRTTKTDKKVFESTLVATRLTGNSVKRLLCYEIPGVTKYPFKPTTYENIFNEIDDKIDAFNAYKTEVEDFPHPCSIEAIENLSIMRGIESGLKRAEAFMLIRDISN